MVLALLPLLIILHRQETHAKNSRSLRILILTWSSLSQSNRVQVTKASNLLDKGRFEIRSPSMVGQHVPAASSRCYGVIVV
ncbi:hypothetical protein NDU88_007180 [Pleurodeles waltl]|uniref:Secreted protein n=1 Tax=Pleurodeles waltl TaxID=8319 RepID=A0AAV7NU42_PLEWA|nr:hypothetical protein NDU88_007180 [Pleurodeles waltl]